MALQKIIIIKSILFAPKTQFRDRNRHILRERLIVFVMIRITHKYIKLDFMGIRRGEFPYTHLTL